MAEARIDGRAARIEAAVAEAARLLTLSRLSVIAGLGTDIAGARAAIALAEKLGGVIEPYFVLPVGRNPEAPATVTRRSPAPPKLPLCPVFPSLAGYARRPVLRG